MFLIELILLVNVLRTKSENDDECPSIYRMLDEQHSFCAEKLSLESLPPTPDVIQLIEDMHNQERESVNAINMQKMVRLIFFFVQL